MRFITRILVGVIAAGALLVGGLAGTASAAAPGHVDAWGPYASVDGKAVASGKVVVTKKAHKEWYWKPQLVVSKECRWVKKKKDGEWTAVKICKPVKKWVKKRAWKWVFTTHYAVHGKLVNKKPWGPKKHRCAWAIFKIQDTDGDVAFKRVRSCDAGERFTLTGEDVARIWVQVARGDFFRPKAFYSAWKPVYHA